MVSATVRLYNLIRAELLPTPSRSHYTFNLRDLSKVVQGVMRADPRSTSDKSQVGLNHGLALRLPLYPDPLAAVHHCYSAGQLSGCNHSSTAACGRRRPHLDLLIYLLCCRSLTLFPYVPSVLQVLCLWLHECSRVFEDRLINDEDHGWFRGQQEALLAEGFDTSYGELVTAPRLIYGDFMVPGARDSLHP